MKNYLSNIDKKLLDQIKIIGREADACKISAYLVGGAVRDVLLKKGNLDIDVVVEADATQFAKYLSTQLKTKLSVYKKYKTASLILTKDARIDLTTARTETFERSGAQPVVEEAKLEDDLFRRDITINAMAIVINKHNFGRLIDIFGGRNDLKLKKIRILHNQSFQDDPTRILRVIRFEQRFNFRIEHKTMRLLNEAIENKLLNNAQKSRYAYELKKISTEVNSKKCLKRLNQLGVAL